MRWIWRYITISATATTASAAQAAMANQVLDSTLPNPAVPAFPAITCQLLLCPHPMDCTFRLYHHSDYAANSN
ncbi:hypothetical protein NJB18091_23550 [Mycobacterium marinum]|nr:hypothetical protein NJB18091_23550 [Mycobacterium marinum]